ncbi:MAG TPA: hypothetical protein VM681_11135 [Candidatus Thermoplasmatota archaeon]|nr:hypothetical protein [Candidatus Thermoplasmatota archaeon]
MTAPAFELFIFRCRACGRVAPDKFWAPRGTKSGSQPGALLSYPSPECPKCHSADVDVNHDYKDGAEAQAWLKAWRAENIPVGGAATNTNVKL